MNGTCIFIDLNSGDYVKNCYLQSTSCVAKCSCEVDKGWDDCSLPLTVLKNIQSAQTDTLTQMDALSNVDLGSKEIVSSIMSSSADYIKAAISIPQSKANLISMASSVTGILSNALTYDLPIEKIRDDFDDVIDTVVAQSLEIATIGNDKSTSVQNDKVLQMVETYADSVGILYMKSLQSGISAPSIIKTIW